MNQPLCQVDGCPRPDPSRTGVCSSCAAELHQALMRLVDDGLAEDLDIALTRQARIGTVGGRGAETPLPYGYAASEAIWVLRTALVGWVRELLADRTHLTPPDTLPGMAGWLAHRVEDLRRHPAGGEAVAELVAAVDQALRVIDRAGDVLYCGPCGALAEDGQLCQQDVYARPGAARAQCRCGAIVDVWQRRTWLLQQAEQTLATATEIARAVTRLGYPVTPDRIWQWAHRGRLMARGRRDEGGRSVPVYRVGDALDLMHALNAPVIAGPACERCEHETCRLIRLQGAPPRRAA